LSTQLTYFYQNYSTLAGLKGARPPEADRMEPRWRQVESREEESQIEVEPTCHLAGPQIGGQLALALQTPRRQAN